MSNLLKISKKYKEEADRILINTGLTDSLKRYGEVNYTGAYAGDVMMHGDIDIAVVRETPYSLEEIFIIFKEIYFERKFKCYFLDGDWNNPKKGKDFPNGHYIGLKDVINDEKWKFDIWFISREEFNKRSNLLSIDKVQLTEDQKERILLFKQYRKDNMLDINGQSIYKAVLEGDCKSIESLKSYLNLI